MAIAGNEDDIISVLVRPAGGDTEMFSESWPGCLPPFAYREETENLEVWRQGRPEFLARLDHSRRITQAIAVWWEGKVVPEGWLRVSLAHERYRQREGHASSYGKLTVHALPDLHTVLAELEWLQGRNIIGQVYTVRK